MVETWTFVALSAAVAILVPFSTLGLKARAMRRQNKQFAPALDNMNQGLCMFDRDTQIVVCNQRYLDMYQLTPEVVKPGCTLRELIEQRKATRLFTGDVEEYCRDIIRKIRSGKPTSWLVEARDGRVVHALNQPMPDGGWVATHEDVSERRRMEKERDEMAALEGRRTLVEGAIEAIRQRIENLLRVVGQSAAAMKATAAHLSGTSVEPRKMRRAP